MSPRAACRLESLGFKEVYDYVTGLTDWTANGLPTEGSLAEILAARDAVQRDVPTCRLTERIGAVRARVFETGQPSCIVTTTDGVVLGRIRGKAWNADPEASVESVMESGPTTVRPDELLEELTERMRSGGVGTILVTTSIGHLVGILHRKAAEELIRARAG